MSSSNFQILACGTAYRKKSLLPKEIYETNKEQFASKNVLPLPGWSGITTTMVYRHNGSTSFSNQSNEERKVDRLTPLRLNRLTVSDLQPPVERNKMRAIIKKEAANKSKMQRAFHNFLPLKNHEPANDESQSVKRILKRSGLLEVYQNNSLVAEDFTLLDETYDAKSPTTEKLDSELALLPPQRSEDFLENLIRDDNYPVQESCYDSDSSLFEYYPSSPSNSKNTVVIKETQKLYAVSGVYNCGPFRF